MSAEDRIYIERERERREAEYNEEQARQAEAQAEAYAEEVAAAEEQQIAEYQNHMMQQMMSGSGTSAVVDVDPPQPEEPVTPASSLERAVNSTSIANIRERLDQLEETGILPVFEDGTVDVDDLASHIAGRNERLNEARNEFIQQRYTSYEMDANPTRRVNHPDPDVRRRMEDADRRARQRVEAYINARAAGRSTYSNGGTGIWYTATEARAAGQPTVTTTVDAGDGLTWGTSDFSGCFSIGKVRPRRVSLGSYITKKNDEQ